MQLCIVATNGPLFVLEESAEVLAYLSAHYPQFAKRSLGWQLSVEEVYYLLELSSNDRKTSPAHPVVAFLSTAAEKQYAALTQTHKVDCLVYSHLTARRGYKLRHGSQFGASFIGYENLKEHGECLFFVGPLTSLEQVRAMRVAHSVGKRAVQVLVNGDADDVAVVQLGGDAHTSDAPPPKKLRRADDSSSNPEAEKSAVC